MSLLIALSFAECTSAAFLRVLFRFVVFFVKIWLANALLRFTLPLAVTEKRLAAPLCVFIFGIFSPLFSFQFFYFLGATIMIMFRPSSRGS
jgi:hypothetical protein